MRLLCMLLIVGCASLFAGDAKAPIPDAAKLKDAEKTIKDLFKEEYAKKTADDKKAFAQKLLQQGNETKDDAASQYVLYKEAAALAAQTGDADTALNAIDALGKTFDLDAAALKAETLAKIVPATPDAAKALVRHYSKAIDDAIAADTYDAAVKLATAAEAIARKAQDVPLVTALQARTKEIRALQTEFAKVKTAQATLKDKPDDPEANLAVGKFLCFAKEDWPRGLFHLAQGNDPALKALAEQDAANPTDSVALNSLADGWWTHAEKQTGGIKSSLLGRAASIYQKALPKLNGLERTRAEKRIAQAAKQSGFNPEAHLLQNLDPSRWIARYWTGRWDNHPIETLKPSFANNSLNVTNGIAVHWYIDLTFKEKVSGDFNLTLEVKGGCAIRIKRTDGTDRQALYNFPEEKQPAWHTVSVTRKGTHYEFFFDGKAVTPEIIDPPPPEGDSYIAISVKKDSLCTVRKFAVTNPGSK